MAGSALAGPTVRRIDRRIDKADQGDFVTICTRYRPSGFVDGAQFGYAFVVLGNEDTFTRVKRIPAFGLFPVDWGKGLLTVAYGEVPRGIIDEALKGSLARITNRLVVRVDRDQITTARSITDSAFRARSRGQSRAQCAAFLERIARSIGLLTPRVEIKTEIPEFYFNKLLEFVNAEVVRTQEAKRLLQRYAPRIKSLPLDDLPLSLEQILSFSHLERKNGRSVAVGGTLTPEAMMEEPLDAEGLYLDIRLDEYEARNKTRRRPAVVYGRAIGQNGKLYLQYWLLFARSTPPSLPFTWHEGDVEMMQVVLEQRAGNWAPAHVDLSQHYVAASRPWPGVAGATRTPATLQNDRPVVYIAVGSHALLFDPGSTAAAIMPWEIALPNVPRILTDVTYDPAGKRGSGALSYRLDLPDWGAGGRPAAFEWKGRLGGRLRLWSSQRAPPVMPAYRRTDDETSIMWNPEAFHALARSRAERPQDDQIQVFILKIAKPFTDKLEATLIRKDDLFSLMMLRSNVGRLAAARVPQLPGRVELRGAVRSSPWIETNAVAFGAPRQRQSILLDGQGRPVTDEVTIARALWSKSWRRHMEHAAQGIQHLGERAKFATAAYEEQLKANDGREWSTLLRLLIFWSQGKEVKLAPRTDVAATVRDSQVLLRLEIIRVEASSSRLERMLHEYRRDPTVARATLLLTHAGTLAAGVDSLRDLARESGYRTAARSQSPRFTIVIEPRALSRESAKAMRILVDLHGEVAKRHLASVDRVLLPDTLIDFWGETAYIASIAKSLAPRRTHKFSLAQASDIVIVLDTSGSMNGELSDGRTRLEAAKMAVHDVVQSSGRKRVGLIVFDRGRAATAVGLSGNRKAVLDAIARFRPEGGTPLVAATRLAMQSLQTTRARAAAIVVISDFEVSKTGELMKLRRDIELHNQACLAGTAAPFFIVNGIRTK